MHHHSCRTALRRTSAFGAAAVVVAVGSSALGVGAATATAAEPTSTSTSTTRSTSAPASSTTDATDVTDVTDATTAPTTTAPAPGTTDPATATAEAAAAPAAEDTGATATGHDDTEPTAAAPAVPDTTAAPTDADPAADPGTSAAAAAVPSGSAQAGTAAPTPAGTVTITGEVKPLHTLTAETAGWPEGTTFTYQWAESFADGAARDIDGAIRRTSVIASSTGALERWQVRVTGTAPGLEPTTVTSAYTSGTAPAPENRFGLEGTQWVTARAGEPFTQSVSAFDGDGLSYAATSGPNASTTNEPEVLPPGMTLSADGTLSGTPTTPGEWSFWLHTSSDERPGGGEISQVDVYVDLPYASALAVGADLVAPDDTEAYWLIDADGPVRVDGRPGSVSLRDGVDTLRLTAGGLAADGGYGVLRDDPVWSSSVSGDTFTTESQDSDLLVVLDPSGAGDRVVTLRSGDLTLSFTVTVTAAPTAVTPAATTHAQHPTTGSLAYTGVETGAPVGWALGLLAAGGGLLLHRARRRG